MADLATVLDDLTVEGQFYTRLDEQGSVRCTACGHRCVIRPGRRGVCQVRFNRDGVLRVPWGYVAALQVDPIEKKPFCHFLPSADALTFGMLGCDFHCGYCQNWVTSQALRDDAATGQIGNVQRTSPEQMIALGARMGTAVVASSYNEPLITSEWALDVFEQAKQRGMECVYVSNGNVTPEVLSALRPYVRGYKIDLKTMQDRQYRRLGGVLQHVLDGITLVQGMGFWEEVVTLVVPGFNDSDTELKDAAEFLASVSPDIPWHVTAFHPDYKMDEVEATSVSRLVHAAEIGMEAGLHYVYVGNLPGRAERFENTYCPACGELLIARRGFMILDYRLSAGGTCPRCGTKIPGVWTDRPESVELASRRGLSAFL
jgi:pyruvate formate lyase activating enzyme